MNFHTSYVQRPLAVLTAILWSLPGQPSASYADTPQETPSVQIVSWTTHNTFTDAKWRPLAQTQRNGPDFTTWVRRNPPAVATLGQPHGFVSLKDERGSLERTVQGNYQIRPNRRQGSKHLVEYVEEWIKGLTQEPVEQSSSPNQTVYNIVTHPRQQSVVQNGQKQILFTFDDEIVIRGRVSHGRTTIPEMHLFQHHSTWVDPVTHLVTRIESRDWGDKMSGQFNQRQILVWDNFHYNQLPPPGVFDWSPPPGANVINMNALRTDKRLRLYLPKKRAKA